MSVPMLLSDAEGCRGQARVTRPGVAGICIACGRYGEPGPQLTPAAARAADGVWECANRRNHGEPPEQSLFFSPAPGSADTHSPAASVAGETGLVCAAGDSHSQTVARPADPVNPLVPGLRP